MVGGDFLYLGNLMNTANVDTPAGSNLSPALKAKIGMFTTIRLVFNAANRLVYPFLTALSIGMHVGLADVTLAISISMATSALGPFIAPVADRYGRRTGMLLGLGIFTVGSALVTLFPTYWTFTLSLMLALLGNNVFLPAMQAYLSDRTPYERRGMVLGVTEMSWALSFILLIPLFGLIIPATNWHTPYAILTGLSLLSMLVIFWLVPGDKVSTSGPKENLFAGLRQVLTTRTALFMLGSGMAMLVANEVVNVVFGAWIEDSYNLQIAALGAASMVIGFSELGGEGLSTLLVDRLGKERSVMVGLAANCLVVFSLPLLGTSLVGAIVWLFLFYLTFEFAVTSVWPLVSEVLPAARATMLAVFIAALSLGRSVGSLIAPSFFAHGFLINGAVAALLNIVSVLLLKGVKLPHSNPTK
jgi:predicted MFS family arabinose efflux permease